MPEKPKRPFLRLDEIEAEGNAAGEKTAREILDDIVDNGGRIDWSALARSGPDVARRLLCLAVDSARLRPPPVPPQPPSRRKAREAKPKVAPPPRVDKNWKSLRTKGEDYRWFAFRAGSIATLIVGLVAFGIIRLLNL